MEGMKDNGFGGQWSVILCHWPSTNPVSFSRTARGGPSQVYGDMTLMARRNGDSGAVKLRKFQRAEVTRRSDHFLRGLEDCRSVTFVSHVHPDPDSLGSMMGLAHLVETCLGKPTRMTRDGQICRAENRAMVELLGIELEPIEQVRWQDSDALVMVDSQPKTGRHSFDEKRPIYAVLDHHQTPGDLDNIPFL